MTLHHEKLETIQPIISSVGCLYENNEKYVYMCFIENNENGWTFYFKTRIYVFNILLVNISGKNH
jgi:hypothetical protein